MDYSQGEQEAYAIAAAVLEGGFILKSLFIIWIVSFCTVRQRQDPARRPFIWMKIAYPLIWT
jgi:hypothetical protein